MPEHPENRMHTKSFENMIKTSGLFGRPAADRARAPNGGFDMSLVDDVRIGAIHLHRFNQGQRIGIAADISGSRLPLLPAVCPVISMVDRSGSGFLERFTK